MKGTKTMLKRVRMAVAALAMGVVYSVAEAQTITALEGVSFEPMQGEVFTFLGPSGQGKTTTIGILAGYVVFNEGTPDQVIADFGRGDIYVTSGGDILSLKAMRQQFAPTMPTAPAAPATGDLDAELRFHLEMETKENLRRGLNPHEAVRLARMKLGGTAQGLLSNFAESESRFQRQQRSCGTSTPCKTLSGV